MKSVPFDGKFSWMSFAVLVGDFDGDGKDDILNAGGTEQNRMLLSQ